MSASLEGSMLLIRAQPSPALPASLSFTYCMSAWQWPIAALDAVLQPSLVSQAAPSSTAMLIGQVFVF